MNPSTEWYKGLNPTQKTEFEKTLRNSTFLLGRINDILESWEKELAREELSNDSFNGDWALKQAKIVGEKRRLKRMKDLISFYKEP